MDNFFKKQSTWLLKEKYHNKECKKFFNDLKRLANGEPLDYLIGNRIFLNCLIDLKFEPLIPRDETEFFTQKIIEQIKQNKQEKIKVLDLFAGSGCVGIAFLKHLNNCYVDFADIDKNCLKQIRKNIKINKIEKGRYKVIESNVFSNIKEKYDYIFANPPYIPLRYKSKVQKSVLKFEPHNALFAEKNGLFFIKEFLNQVKNNLLSKGMFFVEFDHRTILDLKRELKKHKDIAFEIKNDQYGKPRIFVGFLCIATNSTRLKK